MRKVIQPKRKETPKIVYLILFVATFITCTMSGTIWAYKMPTEITNWQYGLQYAILILTFLSAHEFGHYFAARYHKISTSLPYYIPLPLLIDINFGTLGAIIRMRSPVLTKKALFDIGVAGPIAGFVVCLIFIVYGLQTLPPVDFIYSIHPEYLKDLEGSIPKTGLYFGDTLFFKFMVWMFKSPNGFMPPMNEIYHYPFLNVGWFGLFVTTLNMLPMGQLDGGHIVFSMFGRKTHRLVARIVWWFLLLVGIFSLLGVAHELLNREFDKAIYQFLKGMFFTPLDLIAKSFPFLYSGWTGWIVWAIIARLFIKLDHPMQLPNEELDLGRKLIGWLALIILLLSFSWRGIYFVM